MNGHRHTHLKSSCPVVSITHDLEPSLLSSACFPLLDQPARQLAVETDYPSSQALHHGHCFSAVNGICPQQSASTESMNASYPVGVRGQVGIEVKLAELMRES